MVGNIGELGIQVSSDLKFIMNGKKFKTIEVVRMISSSVECKKRTSVLVK